MHHRALTLLLIAVACLARAADPPPDDRYVVATPDGHLARGGRRERFWGFIGFVVPPGQAAGVGTPAERAARAQADRHRIDQMVQRIVDLGFNAVRLWESPHGADWGAGARDEARWRYERGDGSRCDLLAYYLAQLDQRGIAVWNSLLDDRAMLGWWCVRRGMNLPAYREGRIGALALLRAANGTGARAQEAMHLRWEWVQWDADVITLKLSDDYDNKTDSERLIPLEPELRAIERTAHSIRHSFISAKIARRDQNVDRLRKSVGHEDATTTAGYSRLSQFFEREVDSWPDASLWLRRSSPTAEASAGVS